MVIKNTCRQTERFDQFYSKETFDVSLAADTKSAGAERRRTATTRAAARRRGAVTTPAKKSRGAKAA